MTAKRKANETNRFESSLADHHDQPQWFARFVSPFEASCMLVGMESPVDDGREDHQEAQADFYGKYLARAGHKVFACVIRALHGGAILSYDRRSFLNWADSDTDVAQFLPERMRQELKAWKEKRLSKEKTAFRLHMEKYLTEEKSNQIWGAAWREKFLELIRTDRDLHNRTDSEIAKLIAPMLEHAIALLAENPPKEAELTRSVLEVQCKNKLEHAFEEEYEACVANSLSLSFKEFMSRARIQAAISTYEANAIKPPADTSIREWFPSLSFPTGQK